jgi:hypothetical protein
MPHRANYCVRLTHDSNPQWTVASDHAMHQEAVPTAKLQRQSIRGEKRCDSRRNEVEGPGLLSWRCVDKEFEASKKEQKETRPNAWERLDIRPRNSSDVQNVHRLGSVSGEPSRHSPRYSTV